MKNVFTALAITLLSATSVAAATVIEGTWSTPEGCEHITDQLGNDAYLTADGFTLNIDAACDFVTSNEDRWGNLVTLASCYFEDEMFTQTFIIQPNETSPGFTVWQKDVNNKALSYSFDTKCTTTKSTPN